MTDMLRTVPKSPARISTPWTPAHCVVAASASSRHSGVVPTDLPTSSRPPTGGSPSAELGATGPRRGAAARGGLRDPCLGRRLLGCDDVAEARNHQWHALQFSPHGMAEQGLVVELVFTRSDEECGVEFARFSGPVSELPVCQGSRVQLRSHDRLGQWRSPTDLCLEFPQGCSESGEVVGAAGGDDIHVPGGPLRTVDPCGHATDDDVLDAVAIKRTDDLCEVGVGGSGGHAAGWPYRRYICSSIAASPWRSKTSSRSRNMVPV